MPLSLTANVKSGIWVTRPASGSVTSALTGTMYWGVGMTGAMDATETNVEAYVAVACTVTAIGMRKATAGSAGGSYTLRKNGADTAITASMPAGATSDRTTGSIAFAAGDRIAIKLVQPDIGVNMNSVTVEYQFT